MEFLYTKKQKLTEQLYDLHLKCAASWQNQWLITLSTIESKLQHQHIKYPNI